jgi:hypothetical protein
MKPNMWKKKETTITIKLVQQKITQVDKFHFLGSRITINGESMRDFVCRIAQERRHSTKREVYLQLKAWK